MKPLRHFRRYRSELTLRFVTTKGSIPVLSNLYTSTAHLRDVQTLAWYQTTDGGKRWIQTGQIIRPIRSGKDGIAEEVFNGDLVRIGLF